MIKFKKLTYLALTLILLIFSGCNSRAEQAAVIVDDTSRKETVVVADPQAAVEKIYDSLEEYDAETIGERHLRENLEISKSKVAEFYGKISNANVGLADVVIILPEEESRDDIQLALSKYKELRSLEFENYDILDAYSIAQNAVIYDQGEYVIMLMLADNDSARKIIDEYIPL